MKTTLIRHRAITRSLAVLAAGGLVLGAAACGDDSSSADSSDSASASASSGASEGAGASGSTDASDAAGASGSADASDAADASGAADADGGAGAAGAPETDVTKLPAEVSAAYEQAGGEAGSLGAFQEFTTSGDSTLATFANGAIAYSPDTGAQPLIGEIGKTWVAGGGLDNPVGLPTAPETGDASAGWDQAFRNGTIGWHRDDNGTWAATGDGAAQDGAGGAGGAGEAGDGGAAPAPAQ